MSFIGCILSFLERYGSLIMRQDINQQTVEILHLLDSHPEGLARGQIEKLLTFSINYKTLQRRLQSLEGAGKVTRTGDRKGARYYSVNQSVVDYMGQSFVGKGQLYQLKGHHEENKGHLRENKGQYGYGGDGIFSEESKDVLKFLDAAPFTRPKVSYKKALVEGYSPNHTVYIPAALSEKLLNLGQRFDEELAAGTYARQISERLLIDLSWNSSRLEGNTYSRLDTQRLIVEGISAQGKAMQETVMISNHKEAISFLVENAQAIDADKRTVTNLHYLLSQDLLANPNAWGQVRSISVGVGQSAYMPIDNPLLLRDLLELVLLKARKIASPIEQSFFLLVHLSYLQAFEDVNKRTARLSCNIPLIKHNLCPLSFVGVMKDDFAAAMLAVYEKNELAPLLDLYHWAYEQSCNQYGKV